MHRELSYEYSKSSLAGQRSSIGALDKCRIENGSKASTFLAGVKTFHL